MAVVIETTLGDVTVDLFTEQRPLTCLNFLKLCKLKFYNFNLFHTIQHGFIAQTGDPTGEGTGGQSVWGVVEGPEKRYFEGEKLPKIRHTEPGLLSMVATEDGMIGSQFFFTLAADLHSLDAQHCVIGEVTEGHDVLRLMNETICDGTHRPYQDVRITHTVVLEDPFNDPTGLREPSRSPSPSAERLAGGRIAPDEELDETKGKTEEEVAEMIQEKEAKARATILEIVGDLPDAEIAPPENVLFVCKLNPVTTDDDLEIIFSRFGKIVCCEVIRDKKTGDSLQYAFIEFENKKSCEDAFFKMDNVLIDDRRIHVDFSQSVSKIKWQGKGRGVIILDGDKNLKNSERDSKRPYSNDRQRASNFDRHNDADRQNIYSKNDSHSKEKQNNYDSRNSKNNSEHNSAAKRSDRSPDRSKERERNSDRSREHDRSPIRGRERERSPGRFRESDRGYGRPRDREKSPGRHRERGRSPVQQRERGRSPLKQKERERSPISRKERNHSAERTYRDRTPEILSKSKTSNSLRDKSREKSSDKINDRKKSPMRSKKSVRTPERSKGREKSRDEDLISSPEGRRERIRDSDSKSYKNSDYKNHDSRHTSGEKNAYRNENLSNDKHSRHSSTHLQANDKDCMSSFSKSEVRNKKESLDRNSKYSKEKKIPHDERNSQESSRNKKRKSSSDNQSEDESEPQKKKRKKVDNNVKISKHKKSKNSSEDSSDESDDNVSKKSRKKKIVKKKKNVSKKKKKVSSSSSDSSSSESSESSDDSSDSSESDRKKKKSKRSKRSKKTSKKKRSKKESSSSSSSDSSSSSSEASSSSSDSSDSGHERSRKKSKNKKSVREKAKKKQKK